MARISFDASWFQKILKEYNNWKFAWVREAGQNSLDAGATEIYCSIFREGDYTTISWDDNGCGMSKDILVNRFMALGGSKKDGENAAGGFGVAKSILAFAHDSYSISTRGMIVRGKNDNYEIYGEENLSPRPDTGMNITATMQGDLVGQLTAAVRDWVKYTSAPHCKFILKNIGGLPMVQEELPFLPILSNPAAVQDWCKIYLPEGNNFSHGVKVRINGQYMFNTWTSVDACVLVDISGSSLEYLTSNRDGLQYPYNNNLSKLIEQMFKDPKKLFDTEEDVIEVYEGEFGPVIRNKNESEADYEKRKMRKAENVIAFVPANLKSDFIAAPYAGERLVSQKVEDKTVSRRVNMAGRHDIVVLNKTNKDVPANWQPANMKANEWSLFNRWTRIVGAVANILDVQVTLRTGWYFSVTGAAAHKNNSTYGHLILLNPCVLIGESRWQNTFRADKDSFNTLVAYAVHEITHVKEGYHDEDFAREMTLNMAKVFGRMSEVNKAR